MVGAAVVHERAAITPLVRAEAARDRPWRQRPGLRRTVERESDHRHAYVRRSGRNGIDSEALAAEETGGPADHRVVEPGSDRRAVDRTHAGIQPRKVRVEVDDHAVLDEQRVVDAGLSVDGWDLCGVRL